MLNVISRRLLLTLLLIPAMNPATSQAQLTEQESFLLDEGALSQDSAHFGFASTKGDFNGDGFDDLAVGAPDAVIDNNAGAGAVMVFFGTAQGLENVSPLRLTQADFTAGTECSIPETFDFFGVSLAAGDFNADGRDDLAIGAAADSVHDGTTTQPGVGVVTVFFGAEGPGFDPGACLAPGQDGLPGSAAAFTQFGTALAVGDFGTEGFDDLAIGAPGAVVNDGVDDTVGGAVTVIYSSQGQPLDTATAQYWHQDVGGMADIASPEDDFGASLAAGDLVLGGDRACDLAVGAPGEERNGHFGAVHVIFGCAQSGLSVQANVQYTGASFGEPSGDTGDDMGSTLAIGNFDCAGAKDLAIGVPGRNGLVENEGEVWVISGNQLGNPDFETIGQEEMGLPLIANDAFGKRVAAADLGGPCDDLLVGESGFFFDISQTSVVHVLEGRRGSGLVPFPASSHSQNLRSHLGWSMTSGRFNGASRQVALGAPGLMVDGVAEAGAVWLLESVWIFQDDFESGETDSWSAVIGAAP